MPTTILLCTPFSNQDPLTIFLNGLADGLCDSNNEVIRANFTGPISFDKLIASNNCAECNILIFAGHGNNSALLLPQYAQIENRSIFYNTHYLHLGPQTLLAFCCNSATELGLEFKFSKDRTFLGFSGEINFLMAEGECTEWWRKIFHELASKTISDGKISEEMREQAEKIYQEAYNYFRYGEGKKNEYAFWMRAFIHEQKQLLNIFTLSQKEEA